MGIFHLLKGLVAVAAIGVPTYGAGVYYQTMHHPDLTYVSYPLWEEVNGARCSNPFVVIPSNVTRETHAYFFQRLEEEREKEGGEENASSSISSDLTAPQVYMCQAAAVLPHREMKEKLFANSIILLCALGDHSDVAEGEGGGPTVAATGATPTRVVVDDTTDEIRGSYIRSDGVKVAERVRRYRRWPPTADWAACNLDARRTRDYLLRGLLLHAPLLRWPTLLQVFFGSGGRVSDLVHVGSATSLRELRQASPYPYTALPSSAAAAGTKEGKGKTKEQQQQQEEDEKEKQKKDIYHLCERAAAPLLDPLPTFQPLGLYAHSVVCEYKKSEDYTSISSQLGVFPHMVAMALEEPPCEEGKGRNEEAPRGVLITTVVQFAKTQEGEGLLLPVQGWRRMVERWREFYVKYTTLQAMRDLPML